MAEIASAYVTLIPSFKGGSSQIASQLGGPLDRAGRAGGKRFGGAMSTGIAGVGSRIFAPIAAAAAGIGIASFFKDAVSGASDLNETASKVSVIFGSGADAVQEFANLGARALGQTKQQVLDASATFGTFGKAAGLGGQDLAKFSTGFASLSTDMASFSNTSPEVAVQAIGAALRGESEPIRQFGVLLDDATLRTEALKLGLIETTKQALTPQQKVLAAQAAIYKQTSDAQGDFQRTSGGLANQQRILKAQFTDMKTTIGTALLPTVVKVVSAFNSLFDQIRSGSGPINAIKGPLGFITAGILVFYDALRGKDVTNFGVLGKVGEIAYGVRAAFLAALPTVKAFVTNGLGAMAAAGAGIMSSLAPVLKALPGLFAQLLPVLTTVGATILSVFRGAFTQIGPLIAGVATVVLGLFRLILPAVQQLAPVIGGFIVSMQGLAASLIAAFSVIWPPVQRLIAGILTQLVPGLKAIFQVVATEVVPALKSFAQAIAPIIAWLVDKLGPVVKNVFGLVIGVIKGAMKIIAGVIKVVTSVIKGDWKGAWDGIKKIVSGVWTIIGAVVKFGINVIKATVSNGLRILFAIWGAQWNAIKSLVGAAWNAIASAVTSGVGRLHSAVVSGIGRVVAFVRGIPGQIVSALGNIGGILAQAGRDVIQGFIDGITGAFGRVRDTLGSLTSLLPDWKGPAGKDRKLLAPAGKAIIGGFVDGLESQYGTVRASLEGMSKSLTITGGSARLPTPTGGPAGTAAGAGGGVTINGGVHGYTAQEVAAEVERKQRQRETLAFAGGR